MFKFLKNLFKIGRRKICGRFVKFKEGDVTIKIDKRRGCMFITSDNNRNIEEDEMLDIIATYTKKLAEGEI